jgi:hypothetical protein
VTMSNARREFLRTTAAGIVLPGMATAAEPKAKTLNVVVWDERQPEQKRAYDNFLGNQIAEQLKGKPGLAVKSVSIEDDEWACRQPSSAGATCSFGGGMCGRPRSHPRWFSH